MNTLTLEQLEAYHTDGFVLLRGLFDAEETALLRRSAKEDKALDDHAFGRGDGEGGKIRLSLWNHPGDGIYGMFARSQRLVGAVADVPSSAPLESIVLFSHIPMHLGGFDLEGAAVLTEEVRRVCPSWMGSAWRLASQYAVAGDSGLLVPSADCPLDQAQQQRLFFWNALTQASGGHRQQPGLHLLRRDRPQLTIAA